MVIATLHQDKAEVEKLINNMGDEDITYDVPLAVATLLGNVELVKVHTRKLNII